MEIKNLLACGVAAVALVGVSSPALAKKHHHQHQAADTQAAQTRELNLAEMANLQRGSTKGSAATGGTATPAPTQSAQQAAPDSTTSAGAPAPQQEASGSTPAAKPDANSPDLKTASGTAQPEASTTQGATQGGATTAAGTANPSRTMALTEVSNPTQTLARASIETKDGQKVGEVAQVVTDSSGKANAVMMSAEGNRSVRIDASKLVFAPDRGVLVTELTPADLKKTP